MKITGHITPESLMTLEAYHKYRKEHKAEVIAHRKLRSVALGEHMTLQFESELTIRYQIQEMLRIEKIFEEEAIGSIEFRSCFRSLASILKELMLLTVRIQTVNFPCGC